MTSFKSIDYSSLTDRFREVLRKKVLQGIHVITLKFRPRATSPHTRHRPEEENE